MMRQDQRGLVSCVLVDVDGTIAETEGQAHLPAFNFAMEEAGLRWRWDRAIYKDLLKTAGGFERLQRFAAEQGDTTENMRTLLAAVHQNKNRHFAAILASGAVAPRSGFRELVMALTRPKTPGRTRKPTCTATANQLPPLN